MRMMKLLKKILKIVGIGVVLLIVAATGVYYVAARRSLVPDNINMSSVGMDDMPGMDMGSMAMGTPDASAIPITKLVEPDNTTAPVKSFKLTTQTVSLDLGNGKKVDAYSFNGTVPGPELRVQQGDMVVVTLINKLPVSTTIHWHGIGLPNAEDGVAGLTQNAVKPGESYTYRFIANDVGTYWYHSHQETSIQLPIGLYGALIIEPKSPAVHYDHDYTVFLHEWGRGNHTLTGCHDKCPETLTVNDNANNVSFAAQPGETVRVRVVNSGDETHMPVLVGVLFEVIALDGHDLNGPIPLNNVAVPISTAQRFDLSFVMPSSGAVTLIDDDSRAEPAQHPMAIFGADQTNQTTATYPANPTPFDFTTYGTPTTDPITVNSHFDEQYDLVMGTQPGFFNGEMGLIFPINGKTYPNIPSITVKQGDLVKIHMSVKGMIPFDHSMHLHGHYFTVLTHNGKPLSGSPVHLDTLNIASGDSYDVAFLADNPGLWMLHCHMVEHDSHGMDMMVNYPDIYTPYTIGTASGNNPF